jgi:hypothetical protein
MVLWLTIAAVRSEEVAEDQEAEARNQEESDHNDEVSLQ